MEVFLIAKANDVLINEQINYAQLMVIGPGGEKLGLKRIEDALTLSRTAHLDLVLMSSGNNPVAKIMDFNKFRYERQKKEKETKKRQREQNLDLKEYRLSVTIDTHDFETKLRNAKNYLEKGHKVKATVRFRGRQLAHTELGKEVLVKFSVGLEDVAEIEVNPKMEGRQMSVILAPKK